MLKNKKNVAALIIVGALIVFSIVVKLTMDYQGRASLKSMEASLNITDQASNTQETIQSEDTSQSKALSEESVDKKPEIIKYAVKQGDTLESIAAIYNVTADSIAGSSGISKSDIIREGQELRFPSVKGLLYKIRGGETLWDVASTYDIDYEDIASLNGMETPDMLKIGQEIIIPGVDKLVTAVKSTQPPPSIKKAVAVSTTVKVASRGSSAKSSAGSSTAKAASAAGSIWPLSGTITSKFGPRWGTTHKGIDIAAPTGTDVHAFMSGKVIFSGWEGGYGKLVIIDHGNGIQSYYGHNSNLAVSSGQYVNKGQQIADVGATGDATGPHSHFEVRKNGIPVNPLNYLN